MSKTTFIFLAIILLIFGLGGGYYFATTQNNLKSTPEAVITPTISPSTAPVISLVPSLTPTPKVVVVYEAEGSISASDKLELTKKILNPVSDYYASNTDSGKILTITVSPNSQSNKAEYPYSVKVIFETGVNLGFVVERSGTTFAYWKPECMGECPYSQEFKTKYPDIVN